MAAQKVLRPQATAEALLETANAETPAHRFHPGRLPRGMADGVDFPAITCSGGFSHSIVSNLVDAAFPLAPLLSRLRRFDGLFHFQPAEQAGRRVGAAVDAEPTLGNVPLEIEIVAA